MSGRTEQLGKQLRRLRSTAAIEDFKGCAQAFRRATHLVRDLVHEHAPEADPEDHAAALAQLEGRKVIDAALAERIAGCIERAEAETDETEPTIEELLGDGGDLDRFLRSIEHGALAPELAFEAYENTGGVADSATSKSAVTVSGRQIVLAERGHEGMVFVDDKPIGKPFPLMAAPRSKPALHHDPDGVTRIVWEAENLVVALAATFGTASIMISDG